MKHALKRSLRLLVADTLSATYLQPASATLYGVAYQMDNTVGLQMADDLQKRNL